MTGKDISLSIQTFETLIEEKRRYVDKTGDLYTLITSGLRACFLSRPRRFGKSLTVSTLEAIFRGKRALFDELAITQTDYAWPVHPVIRLDMKYAAEANFDQAEKGLLTTIDTLARSHGILLNQDTVSTRFEHLIKKLDEKTGQKVVVLIDEYDKPLIDNLDNLEEAKKIQGLLKRFYGVLKSADEHLRFVFITGVSKFSKVSVFSDLNHLTDLTMDPAYATVVGMTEAELVDNYSDYIQAIADEKKWSAERVMAEIRRWYNGYRFSKQDLKVYNPWSTLSLFRTRNFQEHWYTTGIPKMLVDVINRDPEDIARFNPSDLEQLSDCELSEIEAYDIETLQLIPLMFQTGFLTIKAYSESRGTYTLGYPNWEVRKAFTAMVIQARLRIPNYKTPNSLAIDIREAIQEKNFQALIDHLNLLIAGIPGNLHIPKESYYHSLIHMVFQMSGLNLRSEEWVAGGRMDTVIEEPDAFYIIEFKFNGTAEEALHQIQNRRYSKSFERHSKPIFALGISVDCKTKSILQWISEECNS